MTDPTHTTIDRLSKTAFAESALGTAAVLDGLVTTAEARSAGGDLFGWAGRALSPRGIHRYENETGQPGLMEETS